MIRNITRAAACILLLALNGCGPNYSPNTYASAAVQQANKVDQGVVVGVRRVGVSADTTLGTMTGAAAGGIGGSQLGAGAPSAAFGALGGTVIGGLVGNTVQHATGDSQAFEYVVRESNDMLVSVTQHDTRPLAIGQKVLVIEGKQARVVPDYTVSLPVVTPPAAKTAPSGAAQAVAAAPPPPPGASPAPAASMPVISPQIATPPTAASSLENQIRPLSLASPGSAVRSEPQKGGGTSSGNLPTSP